MDLLRPTDRFDPLDPGEVGTSLRAVAWVVATSVFLLGSMGVGRWLSLDEPLTVVWYAASNLTEPVLETSAGPIHHRWPTPPHEGLPTSYSATWTGCLDVPNTGIRLVVRSDDGIRVRIDDDVMVNRWEGPTPDPYRANRPLPLGRHRITVDYRHTKGEAIAYLGWGTGLGAHLPIPSSAFRPDEDCAP